MRFRADRGFTLVEMIVALTLLALLSAVLAGSLRLVGRSWQGGEAKVAQVDDMRQATLVLRGQLGSMLPKRLAKVVERPLLFAGDSDQIRYVAALPERVVDGGTFLFHLLVSRQDDRNVLVLERMSIDPELRDMPAFSDAERTVLATDIRDIKVSYYGRDADSLDAAQAPTWRDRWDDKHTLPLLIRIEVRPEQGPAWPLIVVEPRRSPEAACLTWDVQRKRCNNV